METIMKDSRSAQPAAVAVEPPPAARRRGPRPFLLLGILLALAVLGIVVHLLLTAGEEETDDAQVEADVVPLGPRVGGQLLRVSAIENQMVRRGETLFEIDPADFQARVAQAEAELATAQAQAAAAEAQERVVEASATGGLASAEAAVSGSTVGVANADAQVAAAEAALERARVDSHRADLDLSRARQLEDESAIAQENLEHAEAGAASASAALAQSEALLAAAQVARRAAASRVLEARGRLKQSSPVAAQLAAAQAATELARARVRSVEASLRLASLQLSYTKVTAPEEGVISKLGAHQGQIVQAGQPLAELVPSRTYVVANFKETQIGAMRAGQRAAIRLDAFPGRVFEGTVESRSGGTGARFALVPPDNASGNFVKVVQRVPIRIAWRTSPDVVLAAGLSADVTVFVR